MLNIIRRELQILIHQKIMILVILLFAASAYVLLIGNLYQGEILQNIPIVVCDLEDSLLSRELIIRMNGNPTQSYLESYIYGVIYKKLKNKFSEGNIA